MSRSIKCCVEIGSAIQLKSDCSSILRTSLSGWNSFKEAMRNSRNSLWATQHSAAHCSSIAVRKDRTKIDRRRGNNLCCEYSIEHHADTALIYRLNRISLFRCLASSLFRFGSCRCLALAKVASNAVIEYPSACFNWIYSSFRAYVAVVEYARPLGMAFSCPCSSVGV